MEEPNQGNGKVPNRVGRTADAILSSFHFWDAAEPVVCSVIDYLALALDGTADIAFVRDSDGRCISSDPEFHLKSCPAWREVKGFFDNAKIKVLFNPIVESGADLIEFLSQ